MVLRSVSGIIFSFFLFTACYADEIKLNPSHPDQYTVVKGDTLWEIAGKFLSNPWQWPDVWEKNAQIENPNLIFPGDVIYLTYVDGQPRLSLGDIKLHPRIRSSSIEQAIKTIPLNKIQQFLVASKVVTQDELDNSPYIIEVMGEHLVAGAGDKIYVRSIEDPQNLQFTIFRKGEIYTDPETQEILGYEASYIAESTLLKSGDPATLMISRSDSEIRTGDRLIVTEDEQVTINFIPRTPKELIQGSIISVLNGVSQIGQHNIVAISRGARDGIEIGHVLDILQRGDITRDLYSQSNGKEVKLPDELAGRLMIFRTFERISYDLVMQATQAIHVLDLVQTP